MRTLLGRVFNLGVALVFATSLMLSANTAVRAHRSAASNLPTLRLNFLTRAVPWTKTLDPAFDTDLIDFWIDELWDAGLVKYNTRGQLQGDLASGWKVSKNHRVYWFYLRKGLRFSNGDPITAQDEAYTLTRAISKATNSPIATTFYPDIVGALAFNAGKASRVRGIKVLGRYTLQISLDRPVQEFLYQMTYPSGMVLDRRVVAGKAPNTYLTHTCSADVGAGPFVFVCRNRSSSLSSYFPAGSTPTMTLVPNKYYYGPKPHIKLVIPTIPTDETQYNQFRAGGIDITTIPSTFVQQNAGKDIKVPLIGNEYLTVNMTTAPFNNEHCRLAVAYGIDRETLANKVLKGTTFASYAVVPKPLLGWYAGNDNPHFDATRARAELAKCPGHLNNVSLPYQHTTTDYDNEYAAIQGMLTSIGANIKLKPITHNDWLGIVGATSMNSTHTTIVQDDYYDDYPDPQDYCTLLLRSGQAYDIGEFKNAQYDSLVDRAEVTPNPARRAALYRQAQHIALATGAYISLRQFEQFFLVKSYVHGLVSSPVYNSLWPRNDDWSQVSIGKH